MNWEDREEGASKQLSGEEDTESRQGPPSTQNTEHRTQNTESRQAPKQGPPSTNAAKYLDQKDTESRYYLKALSHIFAAQMKRRKSPSFAF